jgi:hypothetical protein
MQIINKKELISAILSGDFNVVNQAFSDNCDLLKMPELEGNIWGMAFENDSHFPFIALVNKALINIIPQLII